MAGDLKVGQVGASELPQIGFCDGFARFLDHEGMRDLTPTLVRPTDNRDLLHCWVAKEHPLDLDGGDVFAAADDDVLEAIADFHVTVGMHHGRIAGMKPAVADNPACGIRIKVIPFHDGVSADHDFPERISVVRDLVSVQVDDAEIAGSRELHALSGLDDGTFLKGEVLMFGAWL